MYLLLALALQQVSPSEAFNQATSQYLTCVFDSIRELAPSPETAEMVARGAMAICDPQFRDMRARMVEYLRPVHGGEASAIADRTIHQIQNDTRERLIGLTMTYRARMQRRSN